MLVTRNVTWREDHLPLTLETAEEMDPQTIPSIKWTMLITQFKMRNKRCSKRFILEHSTIACASQADSLTLLAISCACKCTSLAPSVTFRHIPEWPFTKGTKATFSFAIVLSNGFLGAQKRLFASLASFREAIDSKIGNWQRNTWF